MSHIDKEIWEAVIGLEIHVQLNTKSKMFGAEGYLFGNEPNTDIGVVSTGQPGTLPLLNKEAVKKAIQFGCAVKGHVSLFSQFDRKSYFYPDNPKNFQITQFEHPILLGGSILCNVEGKVKEFHINRAHLEEDAGMLKHFTNFSGVDYNRAGVPLLEIVSEACIHSGKEARAYAMGIKAILEYLDVSDCNMDEGSLRIDTNISVRKKGENGLRTKVEIKNMNSFTFMEWAIASEIERQVRFYTAHPDKTIEKGTYRFDPEKKEVILMRIKEDADDYRYFPEPDLPPIVLTESEIEKIRHALPELPFEKYERYVSDLELPVQAAQILVGNKKLSFYFEEVLQLSPHPKAVANWITVEFSGRLKESGKNLWEIGLKPNHVAELVNLIQKGIITGKIAKDVADEMLLHLHKSPLEIVEENPDFRPVDNAEEIEVLVIQVLLENAPSIADYKAGKTRAFGFLVGQVMKLCKGKASPALVNEILIKKLM